MITLQGIFLNPQGKKAVVPPISLADPTGNPAEVYQPDIVSPTNTSPSTERKNVKVKNYLNQQIGDIEVVQTPAGTVTPLRGTGLTKQTKRQDGDMTPDHVKAGTT